MKTIQLSSKFFTDNSLFGENQFPKFEFHIAKEIRKKYEVDDELFSIAGNVVFTNNLAVRKFVKKINDKRPIDMQVKAGEVNAAGLLDEIYHYMFRLYEQQVNPGAVKKALDHLNTTFGAESTRKILFDFVSVFPPLEVYKGYTSSFDYLNSFTADRSNARIVLEEMILLSFANINPANKNILELFDQNYLAGKDLFVKSLSTLELFFQNEKKFGPDNHDLFTFFKTPIFANPDSIEAQLDFIREKWGILLDEKFITRLLSSKDLIREDYSFGGFGGVGGAPAVVPQYKSKKIDADFLMLGKSGYKYAADVWKDYEEPENFTSDIDWMPKVVLLAKNTYVWLDQLSKKYQRHIKTLDQIPDEELDLLASHGFNGLWLIGIWERSGASKKIKHILGNIDAVASAYSLYDYQIAWDIGGEDAYNNLNHRARARGIRLASDMVPNHTGIFSKWVVDHPDYFIQTNNPPFPNHRFSGPDLSDDQSVQLRIEDGYWNRSDAAVVFQRIDNRTGETIYIYHGNDGTNMPWNDTAQLNMLKAEVREAVIQKIFEVARKFSIIRFDAAMTLAKKHFSRLWYPAPGRGGDIPSRTDYAMSQKEFDELFPKEFWREVVDRINAEMPETLLLAEAFWLMEGYFVRTLGMHRVYNSAFMHMMMKEENAKYRDLISNTLEFEPEILKRYVNFMSNPDEETAIKQFGTDDKYFGVCTMMVTLPGLPMFAHGQIEGYTEKYGMEYQRAYYHEVPNQWLIDRHQREIFPLMKKRYLFSNVTNFWLFDFIDGYGSVNENVFVFSNFERGERTLVFFNNKFEYSSGRILSSSPKLVDKQLQTKSLAEALQLNLSPDHFYMFREHVSGLEYLKSGKDFANGFNVELGAFKYLVYLDFHEIYDEDGNWKKLARRLQGNGVPSVARTFAEMILEPVHAAFEELFDPESLSGFIQTCILDEDDEQSKEARIKFIDKKYGKLLKTLKAHTGQSKDIKPILNDFDKEILAVKSLNEILEQYFPAEANIINNELHKAVLTNRDANYNENSLMFVLKLAVSKINCLFEGKSELDKKNYIEKFLLDTPIGRILQRLGKGGYEVERGITFLNIFNERNEIVDNLFVSDSGGENKEVSHRNKTLIKFLDNSDVKNYIGANEYHGTFFYSKENFEEILSWIFTFSLLQSVNARMSSGENSKKKNGEDSTVRINEINLAFAAYKEIVSLSDESGYKLDALMDKLQE
ncbi:MAG: alpha-amylase [Ignavibacteriales bacterium]|nr:alpha-amylase [Ignavibacteriales bacterium]